MEMPRVIFRGYIRGGAASALELRLTIASLQADTFLGQAWHGTSTMFSHKDVLLLQFGSTAALSVHLPRIPSVLLLDTRRPLAPHHRDIG